MFNWLDWILLALLIAGCIRGLSHGAIGEAGGLVGFAVGLIAAVVYAPSLAAWLSRCFPNMSVKLGSWLAGTAATSTSNPANPLAGTPLADLFNFGLPRGSFFGQWLGGSIMTVISFLIILALGSAIVISLAAVANSFLNHTPLGWVNRLGGVLIGGFVGAISLGMVLSLLAFFCKLNGFGVTSVPISDALNRSVLALPLARLFTWVAAGLKMFFMAP